MRRSASLMPTRCNNANAFCPASFLPSFLLCTRAASISCVPIRINGLREVIGSWKITLMRLPRKSRRVFSSASKMEMPSNVMRESLLYRANFSGSRRMMDMDVTDLPEPDSPTKANVSPSATLKLTLRTACTVFSCSSKLMSRFSTTSNCFVILIILLVVV